MPDTGTKSLGAILSSGTYRIPSYQRGYAWTTREVNEFMDDLEYVTDTDTVDSHYVNSIIVTQGEGNELLNMLHVIDGQQRLLTSSLLASEILRQTFSIETNGDQDAEHVRNQIEELIYNDVYKTSLTNIQHRVLPASEHQDIYKRLVPTDVEAHRDIEKIREQAQSPSEQKLVDATKVIGGRLNAMLEGQTEPHRKLLYLSRVATTLHKHFVATLHEVKNPAEAGRIFEAINDRGRSLNRADRIKSYLVYRASLSDVGVRVQDLHETFTIVYEVLNTYATDPSRVDDLIDRLIGHHWTMFAGERSIERAEDLVGRHEKVNEDIDQIKYANYHVPKEAEDKRVGKWMEAYQTSLLASARAYVQFRGTRIDPLFRKLRECLSGEVDESEVRHSLYAIERFGPSTTHSLLAALHIRFADASSFGRLARSLEKLVLRMFGVGGARRDTKRHHFESLARVLFWSSREDLAAVFPEGTTIPEGVAKDRDRYEINGEAEDAEQVIRLLNKWSYQYSHRTSNGKTIDEFRRRLEEDHLDGLGVAGWGGVTNNELKNYLLYRYECEIRRGGASVPEYLQAGIYDYTIEHVWPRTCPNSTYPEGLTEDQYAQYVERIGNLAFLSLSENASAGNRPYEEKWTRTYQNAADGTKMVREEFPDPTGERENDASRNKFETWGSDVIKWRGQKIASVLARYWGYEE